MSNVSYSLAVYVMWTWVHIPRTNFWGKIV